ncbi:MAG: MBL fold metallo-hydrolase, partial [Actinobacteria bacterium]|nr:MBL fold metallo-hydrolase [Actinomycetota bacterium]
MGRLRTGRRAALSVAGRAFGRSEGTSTPAGYIARVNSPVFNNDFTAGYGAVERVAPGIRRVLAHNPSKYSAWGTGTYLIGGDAAHGGPGGPVAVVDPGPDLESHHEALERALDGEVVAAILITHTHADHSPASKRLAERTGAPRYGFGPHPFDTDELARADAANDADLPDGADTAEHGEAHSDLDFMPDVVLGHGDIVGPSRHPGATWRFEALHTPGHLSNHLCFAELERGALFSGDHVMGWSTTVVSPPAGDMAAYLASLELLLERPEHVYYPTHGPAIIDPVPFVRSLIDHRRERDRQLLSLLAERGEQSVAELVEVIYTTVRAE